MKLKRTFAKIGLGALAAYLLDPQNGRLRRQQLKARGLRARRSAEEAVRKLRRADEGHQDELPLPEPVAEAPAGATDDDGGPGEPRTGGAAPGFGSPVGPGTSGTG